MKKILYVLICLCLNLAFAQKEDGRIQNIKNQLTILSTETIDLLKM